MRSGFCGFCGFCGTVASVGAGWGVGGRMYVVGDRWPAAFGAGGGGAFADVAVLGEQVEGGVEFGDLGEALATDGVEQVAAGELVALGADDPGQDVPGVV